jgi:hypothetical protein
MSFLWLYDLPSWLFGLIVISACAGFAVGGLVLTRKWVSRLHQPHSHNDVVSFYFAAICVFYGITLGLLAIGTWTTLSETEAKADQEATAIAALYRDVSTYPESARAPLQEGLKRYTREVIDVAWPAQQKGLESNGGGPILNEFQQKLTAFEPSTEGQIALHAEALSAYNKLIETRRARKQATTAGLSSTLWIMIVLGAMLTLAVTWFFYTANFGMHFWMTFLFSVLLGLEVFLLADMDHPFWGSFSVGSDAYELVFKQLMEK